MRRVLLSALAGAGIALAVTPAQATTTVSGNGYAIGNFSGQDCPITGPGNPGFSGCWATQTGVFASANDDPTASRVVAAMGLSGTTDISTNYPTISGNEFAVSLNTDTNVLSFTYTAGAGDPVLHYISIKQANGYELFYNLAGFDGSGNTTYTFSLSTWFPNNPGVSHLTVYDSSGVPEPATWALMLLGFGGIGMAMRRRRSRGLMQIA